MKLKLSIINVAFVLFLFTFLVSCSIQKRVYKSGFYFETTGKTSGIKSNANSHILNNDKKPVYIDILRANEQENLFPNASQINTTQSKLNYTFINPSSTPFPSNSKSKSVKSEFGKENSISENFKKLDDRQNIEEDKDSDSGLILRVFGWIIWSIGILAMLFSSTLIGTLIACIGLIFIFWGGKSKKKNNSGQKNEKTNVQTESIDVVYLKNGSVIKGTIIEQIPNVSIKIKTKDGNVFVYKMEEIEKTTREELK